MQDAPAGQARIFAHLAVFVVRVVGLSGHRLSRGQAGHDAAHVAPDALALGPVRVNTLFLVIFQCCQKYTSEDAPLRRL
jgi:hypothetical protein